MIYNDLGSFGFINEDSLTPAPLLLYDMGLEARQGEIYDYDNRYRDNYPGYLFQYTLAGHGYFETGGRQRRMAAGSAFLVALPHDSRYYIQPDNTEAWLFFYLHFDGTVAAQIVDMILARAGCCLSYGRSPAFADTFCREHREILAGKQYERYQASVFLYRFLTELLRETQLGKSPSASPVEKGRQWIQKNYHTVFSLSELCDSLSVSLPHFSRQFRTIYGQTPLSYINRLRVEYAIALLLNSSLGIQEIAEKSGFSDRNYFAKVFRRYMDMSPTAYRESHQSGRPPHSNPP